tara:strand:+ start:283 stop:741 length:459 start_codon:yes stop_codon:yes gene_type:complete
LGKPVYRYPEFVTNISLDKSGGKRYWLNLKIEKTKKETIIVILKNPSKANEEISDKTVYTVTKYISKNSNKYPELRNIGNIIILNLTPIYLTDSTQLQHSSNSIVDTKNETIINHYCNEHKKVIIAWGNHPNGLFTEYEVLKSSTLSILKKQ